MTELDDALERLGLYNGGTYSAGGTPQQLYAFGGVGGMDTNWVRCLRDVATVGGAARTGAASAGLARDAAVAAAIAQAADNDLTIGTVTGLKEDAEAARDAAIVAKGQAEAAAAVAVAAAYSMEPAEIAGTPATLDLVMTGPAALPPGIFSRTSAATYYDAAGVLRTAANNQPRFDHNPTTGARRGLLIERSATNLLLQSEAADNAAWTKVAATVSANAVAAPDGATTADKLVEDTSSATGHYDAQIASGLASGGTYTYSRFVKAGERTTVMLRMQQSENVVNGTFNLATGTATLTSGGAWTGAACGIEALPNGWYRCFVTATLVGSTAASCLTLLVSDGFDTYTGNGTSGAYVWGAFLETGSYPTSYIATAGSTVTRAADLCSTTDMSWCNAKEGTFVLEASVVGASYQPLLQVDSGLSDRMLMDVDAGQARFISYISSAAVVGLTSLGSVAAGASVRFAATYAPDNYAAVLNGGSVSSDLSAAVPAVTRLRLGHDSVNTATAHIRRLTYFPRRIANNTLQLLSAG